MSIAELKEEAKALNEAERRELMAYLVQLDQGRRENFVDMITRRIDDKEKFVRWNDIKTEFTER